MAARTGSAGLADVRGAGAIAAGAASEHVWSHGRGLALDRSHRELPRLQAARPLDLLHGATVNASHAVVLRAAAAGDDEALTQLVRLYHDRVYRFGLRACRDAFDADDAVQDAFVKLAARPDVVRDRGALSWLLSVVRHTCMRMLRPFVRE